ncbi:hypothetical protein PSTT_09311 [Puccinia striiformis]|uniref:Inhibitor I9 domain-containing protein n=1 Tax=Puccinia striiformis TaxID=27350 RepID=A0A2S4V925_9BASI|nr:hypothetical protein PSTT_09311 [Puccinia striiformis]
MANQRFSNRFIIVLLVAFIGLVLPSLVSSAVTPGVTGSRAGPTKLANQNHLKVTPGINVNVYDITWQSTATPADIKAFEGTLPGKGITILYPLKSIGGIVVSMTANQLKTIKDASVVLNITKDKGGHSK